jgi:hypothetical protein
MQRIYLLAGVLVVATSLSTTLASANGSAQGSKNDRTFDGASTEPDILRSSYDEYDCTSEDCHELMRLPPQAVAKLTAWIVAKTGWRISGIPPVVFVPPEELLERFVGRGNGSTDIHLRALYSRTEQTIFLSQAWNYNDVGDRGALLHELVHYLQQLNHVKAECVAAYERQAYDLHMAWLREAGVQDPYDFLNIDEFTIRAITMCPL